MIDPKIPIFNYEFNNNNNNDNGESCRPFFGWLKVRQTKYVLNAYTIINALNYYWTLDQQTMDNIWFIIYVEYSKYLIYRTVRQNDFMPLKSVLSTTIVN